MSKPVFTEAPNSVIHLAEAVIHRYHIYLEDARIAFVMRSEPQKRGDRFVIGQCSKVPEKMQPYLEYDYLIWLSNSDWDDMSDAQREALIDHELCHCKRGKDGFGWSIREHDLQEFSIIVARHGLWTPELRRMNEAVEEFKQDPLPLGRAEVNPRSGKVGTITGAVMSRISEVTISGAGQSVTMTGEEFDSLPEKFDRLANELGD